MLWLLGLFNNTRAAVPAQMSNEMMAYFANLDVETLVIVEVCFSTCTKCYKWPQQPKFGIDVQQRSKGRELVL